MKTEFKQLPIGEFFTNNGNAWRKKSTRTASHCGRTSYFGQRELVLPVKHEVSGRLLALAQEFYNGALEEGVSEEDALACTLDALCSDEEFSKLEKIFGTDTLGQEFSRLLR